jgi:DNA polymerase III sliding clamp (beta) subunit (PCNA family)
MWFLWTATAWHCAGTRSVCGNGVLYCAGKSLSEVSKLLRDEDTPAELGVAKRHILFRIGGYQIVSRLLEGEFLDYRSAIPVGEATVIQINTRELINAIERRQPADFR